jgi:type II secretory pathway pseudopilin PulG
MRLRSRRLVGQAAAQEGFTMIIAIGVMLVTSLLLVAAFTVANGDVHNTRRETAEKQAYYAALAGIQQYEHELQVNPNFWQTCAPLESEVPEEKQTHYVVKPLPATGQTACSTTSPFTTMIESKGIFANTFRVKSVGTGPAENVKAPQASKTIIATFGVNGFLDYVFYTNLETEDPGLYAEQPTEARNTNCANKYCTNEKLAEECAGKNYETWHKEGDSCPGIEFGTEKIVGPMHTNDTSWVQGATIFGRKGNEPPDVVEMLGGTYGSQAGCKSSAKYYTATGCYIKGESLPPPPNDESLAFYVKPEYNFEGVTKIKLEGATMTITNNGVEKKSVAWPENGLIYVQNRPEKEGACAYHFEPENSDNSTETTNEVKCGNVYVQGSYEKSLTVAGSNDVIVTGSLYPTSVAGKLASSGKEATEPTGTAVLGLIANDYVRVYHPCSGGNNQTGYFKDPWIYAGILATQHSWIVDNSSCGDELGTLNVYGAIGQNYRGVVLRGNHGFVKNYEYDDRLATDEPPYFLAPLKAGWKIVKETATAPG